MLSDAMGHATSQPDTQIGAELQVAALVAEVAAAHVGEDLSSAEVVSSVRAFCEPLHRHPTKDAASLLAWFRDQGFGHAISGEVGLHHSNLVWVISQRQGIPITLAILLLHGARVCGLEANGINFPGYFLLRIADEAVDPLRVRSLAYEELPEAVAIEKGDIRLWQEAQPAEIGLRMLNNLKALHIAAHDWPRALEIADLQLGIARVAPTSDELCASLHFERGEYWRQLGALAIAKDAYLLAASEAAPSAIREKAALLARSIASDRETVH